MRTGVLAKKIGMTRVFAADGAHVPVTVLSLEGCQVVGVKKDEVRQADIIKKGEKVGTRQANDGYSALVLGAGVAAWHQQRNTPLSHGVLTSSGVFVTVQIVFSVIKVIQGDSISWGRIVVSLGLSLVAGICGGMLGSIMLRRGTVPRR